MVRNVIIGVLAVALVAVGIWGYKEHQDKNAVLIHAENNYQQAYHNLTYYVDQIHDHLGTALAASSMDMARPELSEVWRLSSLARGDIGQLPLTLLPFNQTAEFLSNLGKFSFQTAVRSDQKISGEQYQQLEALYRQSDKIENDLRDVQKKIADQNMRWMDVEMALASQKQPMDNQIIDGLRTVNKKVEGFDNKWDPAVTRSSLDELSKLNHLSGKPVSESEAAKKLKAFVGIKNGSAEVQKIGKGANYKGYTVTVNDPKTHHTVVASITEKGGHVIWFFKERPVSARRYSLYRGDLLAKEFLKTHGYPKMDLVKSDQYDNVGVYTYVRLFDAVRDYPSSVRIKVALDNGEILGFDQREYLVHMSDQKIDLKPKLTSREAKKELNKNMKVQEEHLAIYENELEQNVLCYEYIATKGNDTYRILVNANTGKQEKVELMNA
ncbi:germination protein YpeB [Tuberibacillus calidus]|uniref:germination protein YpeB n=1 Tax=Tuberibacillus calidus TaxID=340097 RepID=UPI0004263C31|nr:germination protein YpeB [Tuberibacillus calidus]